LSGRGIQTVSPWVRQCAMTNLHSNRKDTSENLTVRCGFFIRSTLHHDWWNEFLYKSVSISRKRGDFGHLHDFSPVKNKRLTIHTVSSRISPPSTRSCSISGLVWKGQLSWSRGMFFRNCQAVIIIVGLESWAQTIQFALNRYHPDEKVLWQIA
jgi:hypothetical protein